MRRTTLRLLTAALVAAGSAVLLVPVSSAAEGSTLTPSVEAWYQPDPTCGQATGCLTSPQLPVTPPVSPPVAVPLSPYPAGTLHVAWAGQAETARAYLAFSFADVAGPLTSAALDVPLDTAAADGDQQSATAKVQACLATGDITHVEGSIAPPPTVDCTLHVALAYVATPSPHLHGDLAPLLVGLPTTTGLALLPDAAAEKAATADAWHVTFSAHDRTDSAKTAPARLTVTTADAPAADVPAVDAPAVSSPELGGTAPAPAVDSGTSLAALPPAGTTALPPAVQAPAVAAPAVPSAVVPQAATVTYGYQYPAVWLVPLALLVLVPAAARALTKDLAATPRA